ncbi:hypothetical protein [Bradyrhizobium centrosematis]|uniref:hypothetical protein n=1 Tax=Bradyrhizobium centrosematis TaxID=1300039 RepID=UPI00388EA38D
MIWLNATASQLSSRIASPSIPIPGRRAEQLLEIKGTGGLVKSVYLDMPCEAAFGV